MATIDYTAPIPGKVTITNTAKVEEVYDAGTRTVDVVVARSGDGDLVVRPDEISRPNPEDNGATLIVKRKYKDATRNVQLYKNNAFVKLEAGDVLELLIGDSSYGADGASDQIAYYKALDGKNDLTVTIAAVE